MRLINSCRSTRNNEQLFSIRRRRDVHRSKKRKGQQGKRARSTIKSKVRGRAKKRTKKKNKEACTPHKTTSYNQKSRCFAAAHTLRERGSQSVKAFFFSMLLCYGCFPHSTCWVQSKETAAFKGYHPPFSIKWERKRASTKKVSCPPILRLSNSPSVSPCLVVIHR